MAEETEIIESLFFVFFCPKTKHHHKSNRMTVAQGLVKGAELC